MMERTPRIEDEIVGATQEAVGENLDSVEAGVAQAIDETKEVVQEVRHGAQKVVDHALRRVKGAWEQRRPKVEEYVTSHPWVVLGSILLFAYLIVGGTQRSRQ
jgi:ElaB/YqjD/DUF883 family membrane-anchored ribosome-binding protein